MDILRPFASPLYVMAKPAGARCNLSCRYCYYLEKGRFYSDETDENNMSDELLECFVRQYIEAQTTNEVLFIWHGGEPLLRPISFYRKALALQRKYACGRVIDNCIQTNGTLLTDEWCRFFYDNNFLVGISIDGPQHFHDKFRHGSFGRVMHGVALLNRYGVEWNAMATVNSFNVEHPVDFYRFFRNIGCRFLQFTPIVERRDDSGMLMSGLVEGGILTKMSISPIQWGGFLCAVFDEWLANDVGEIFVQIFEATVANYVGVAPGICSLAPVCGHSAVLEYNGDVYSCDHFVFPQYRIGNIRDCSITGLMHSDKQHAFGRAKRDTLTRQCRECRFLFACHGECPKNRFVKDRYGNPNHNYLCEGYRMFFEHTEQQMLRFSQEYSSV